MNRPGQRPGPLLPGLASGRAWTRTAAAPSPNGPSRCSRRRRSGRASRPGCAPSASGRPRGPILQATLAATVAWLVATEVIGHTAPFFAPVSAMITLGLTQGERGRARDRGRARRHAGHRVADLLVLRARDGLVAARGRGRAGDVGRPAAGLRADVRPADRRLGRARGHAAAARRRRSPSRARSTRWWAAASRWRSARSILPGQPGPDGPRGRRAGAGRARRRCSTTSRPRCACAAGTPCRRRSSAAAGSTTWRGSSRTRSPWAARPRGWRRRGARRSEVVDAYADAAGQLDLAVRNVRVLARGARRAMDLDENVPPELGDAVARAGGRGPRARSRARRPGAGRRGAGARPARRRAGDDRARAHGQPLGLRDRRPGPLHRGRPAARDRDELRRRGERRAARRRRRREASAPAVARPRPAGRRGTSTWCGRRSCRAPSGCRSAGSGRRGGGAGSPRRCARRRAGSPT